MNPLKQGLKLDKTRFIRVYCEVKEVNPLKQGLKLGLVLSGIAGFFVS